MRAEGFYWVKRKSTRTKFATMDFSWEVARFEHLDDDDGLWTICGWDGPYGDDDDLGQIDERPLERATVSKLRALPLSN